MMAERRYGNIPSRMISGSYDNKIVRLVNKDAVRCERKVYNTYLYVLYAENISGLGIIYVGIWWVNTRTKPT